MSNPSNAASATVMAVAALYEAISALGEVPSGHLYAHVMGHLTMEQYNSLIGIMKRTGLITESGHVLKVAPLPKAA